MNSLLCFNPVIVESAAASGLIPKIAPVAQSRFKIERWMCGIKREISAVGHRQCTLGVAAKPAAKPLPEIAKVDRPRLRAAARRRPEPDGARKLPKDAADDHFNFRRYPSARAIHRRTRPACGPEGTGARRRAMVLRGPMRCRRDQGRWTVAGQAKPSVRKDLSPRTGPLGWHLTARR